MHDSLLLVIGHDVMRPWEGSQSIKCLFISFFSLCPESPRWLYFKGRRKELKALLLKTVSVNKRTISENFFETLPEPKKEEGNVGFHKLFSHKTLAIRTIVLYINW